MNKIVIYSLIGVVVLAALVAVGMAAFGPSRNRQVATDNQQTESMTGQDDSAYTQTPTNTTGNSSSSTVSWQYGDSGWQSSGTPPTCADPFTFKSPVDLSKATAILYPGQSRGGNYKPHGGFRFDGAANNAITVAVPADAQVVEGSRYLEIGETQYMFDFQTPCGIRYRLDHLHTLSPTFQALADKLPAAKADDTRTSQINPPTDVKAGDTVATAVGFVKTSNASLDWGVYDLRTKNGTAQQDGQLAAYGVCWFDWLSATDEATVRALPAGDPTSGKTSDYCK